MKGVSQVALPRQLILLAYGGILETCSSRSVNPACHFHAIVLPLVSRGSLNFPVLLVPERSGKSNFHLRQKSNGSSLRWVSLLLWCAFKSSHKNSLSNVYAHTHTHALTNQTLIRHTQAPGYIRTYTHAHRKIRSCHIRFWSNAETIFKKQQNAIFSECKSLSYMLKPHVVKST